MRRCWISNAVLAVVLLLAATVGAKDARAYWTGWPGVDACPTINGTYACNSVAEACESAAAFIRPSDPVVISIDPSYGTNGLLTGYICTVKYTQVQNQSGPTSPYCTSDNRDAMSQSGCTQFTAPNPSQIGSPSCSTGRAAMVGNPVNVATGNKFEQATDYESVGPDKLAFTRYYNGQSRVFSSLGFGWSTNFDRKLTFFGGRASNALQLYVRRADGAMYQFNKGFNGWAAARTDTDGKLTTDGATVWTYTDSDDTVETYDFNSGRLVSARTRSGYQQNLQYDGSGNLQSVTDSFGRTLAFSFATGVLQSMTDPDGKVYRYGYNIATLTKPDRLIQVTYPGAAPQPTVQYVYENATFPYALTGIVDENGSRFATWTYDAALHATSSVHVGGADNTTMTYNLVNGAGTVTVTNPLGKQAIYKFSALQGVPKPTEIDGQASTNCPAASAFTTYDSRGYVASRKDWNGNTTTYTNDARGQPLTITEASGTPLARTTTITWHATFHVPTQIAAPGKTTSFTYDANGLLTQKTEIDTTSNSVPYNTNGQTRSWTYAYTPGGELATITGPRTDVSQTTQFAYNSAGYLASVTNALGQVTQVTSVNGRGMPLSVTDPKGVATNFTYDDRGRLLSRTVVDAGGNAETSFAYDSAGNITRITLPDGSQLNYEYDAAHRLTAVQNALGERIEYTLDAMGNATQVNVKSAAGTIVRTQSHVFDELGRLLKNIGAANQTTVFGHDNNGNLTAVTDPLQQPTGQAFDALNRLIRVTDALGGIAAYGYDSRDNLTSVTDPRNLATTYVYDGFGNAILISDPVSAVTIHYDPAGNRTSQTDARGVTTNFTYDALDRLTAKTFPASPSENVTFAYDDPAPGKHGIGRLTAIADEAGTAAYSYDARGNTVSETHTVGGIPYVTGYAYDLADNLIQMTYPSGRIVAYQRDSLGRVTAVTTQADANSPVVTLASGITYSPFGPMAGLTYGNGVALNRQLDQDYRITHIAAAGANPVQDLALSYDAAGDITGIADIVRPARSQSFGYDPLYRLTQAQGIYGTIGYSYDAAGNRLSATIVNGGTTNESYTVSPFRNQLQSVANGTATRTLAYDAAGNLTQDDRGDGNVYTLAYNNANRLAAESLNGQPGQSYTVDALGRRAVKSDGSSGTVYGYDLAGRPIAENTLSGGPIREYVNLEGMPLALIANGQVYAVHGDHLGTPQQMTDQSGGIAWDAAFLPFGQASQLWAPVPNNTRFPGQYFDAETGFHHNGFRDYDPSLGRYIESDPIGLAGGLNTYAYAGGNPVNRIDPSGLGPEAVCLVAPAACAGIAETVGQFIADAIGVGIGVMSMSSKRSYDAKKADAGKMCQATERDDPCLELWMDEYNSCGQWTNLGVRAVLACRARANDRLSLCRRDGGPQPSHPPRWSPFRDHFR